MAAAAAAAERMRASQGAAGAAAADSLWLAPRAAAAELTSFCAPPSDPSAPRGRALVRMCDAPLIARLFLEAHAALASGAHGAVASAFSLIM